MGSIKNETNYTLQLYVNLLLYSEQHYSSAQLITQLYSKQHELLCFTMGCVVENQEIKPHLVQSFMENSIDLHLDFP